MYDHKYCRILLADIMPEVRSYFTAEEIKAAWSYNVGRGPRGRSQFEFHGPHGYYDHDVRNADCKWSALAGGWRKLLDKMAEKQ